MTLGVDDQEALAALEFRLRTILPEEYQDCYEDVQPVSMGSAGLKYGADGNVAWNEMWATFCDLAMAGGPPHKGMLLEPGAPVEIDANSARYAQVVDEIVRGVRLVTGLAARAVPHSRMGARGLSQRHDGWMAAAGDRDGERLGSRRGLGARPSRGPRLPARERDQERRHRRRQDLPLLDGTHVARPEAGDRRSLREDGGRVAARRARERRHGRRRTRGPLSQDGRAASTRTPGLPDRVIATLAGSGWSARASERPSG